MAETILGGCVFEIRLFRQPFYFMDIKQNLADFKEKVDREIELFFDKVIRESSKKDVFVTDALKYARLMVVSGGKRIRPALMYWGYRGCGGAEEEKIIRACVAIELIHVFLLIHDDVIDQDLTRHGVDTMNNHYAKLGKRIFPGSDEAHFGDSISIIVGDMIGALGNQIIFDSKFSPELIMKALSHLQSVVSLTVIGQSKDIYMEYKKEATEKEVLEMYEFKTARYTIEGPLQLGAILGGASEEILKSINRFSVPIGIAFQIQDDILGIFGEEEKIGKSVGADIKEGKQTILLVKAKESASSAQRKILNSCVGKENLSSEDVEMFREVVIKTGSLDYAKSFADNLIREGIGELKKVPISSDARKFLLGMAEYMMKREV